MQEQGENMGEPTSSAEPAEFFSERDWKRLIRDIHNDQVIPVVGPGLITVPDPENPDRSIQLLDWLAPRLAEELGVDIPEPKPGTRGRDSDINTIVCSYLLKQGSEREEIYQSIREILEDQLEAEPAQPLLDLAAITDFRLFISTCFDPLLGQALASSRNGFDLHRSVLRYHPTSAVDIPEPISNTLLYHILGDAAMTYPDFAVWEEDYIEYIFGLHGHTDKTDTMENLARRLKSSYLLLLGAPYQDWVVRFFLRAAKQHRLSERVASSSFLSDHQDNLSEAMVFYFDRVSKAAKVIPGNPTEFVRQLSARWRDRYSAGDATWESLRSRLPADIPKDSVFISYAREDKDATLRLVNGLTEARVPVWLDLDRLEAGGNYERNLEGAVKDGSFFISVISRNTESDPERYCHRERKWASQRHVDGFVFYIPVVIDDAAHPMPKLEPPDFSKIHYERLPGGEVTPGFASRMNKLCEEFRLSGRPRA